MLGSSKAKSSQSLERTIAKYEAKLAKAANPTQRAYASSMLSNARKALAASREDEPAIEPAGDDVVDLHKDEYEAR
jgi:hypothetical protein